MTTTNKNNSNNGQKKKSKNPGYGKIIMEAITFCKGSASFDDIHGYITKNYPSTEFKIAKGSRFNAALTKNLGKATFKLDKTSKKYSIIKSCLSGSKAKSKVKLVLPHREALVRFRCCEEHPRMHVDDMDKLLPFLVKECNARKVL